MLLLSNDSIGKILSCLEGSANYLVRFRRTCKAVETIAKQRGFYKVKANTIVFGHHESFGSSRLLGAIEFANSHLVRPPLNTVTHSVDFFSHCINSSDFIYSVNIALNRPIETCICEAMANMFSKAKYVACISFENLAITPEILEELAKYQECIRHTTQLIIQNYRDCTYSVKDFRDLLNLTSVNSITMIPSIRHQNTVLSNCHLRGLQTICIGSEDGQTTINLRRITDKTVENWKENMPIEIKLHFVRTSFTFQAIWDFIQHVILHSIDPVDYHFGIISGTPANFEAVTEAQKTRSLQWKQRRVGDNSRIALTYTEETTRTLRFTFYIDRMRRND